MENIDYKSLINNINPKKRLGQNFLLEENIARAEAAYGKGRKVVELGPGLGILTRELCAVAKSVLAIEKDSNLYEFLKDGIRSANLNLANGDFFEMEESAFNDIEIMISNIPYNLSSKTVFWLSRNHIPAVLCLQKEFVEHMLALPDTRDYSRLSVLSSLQFNMYEIMDVKPSSFYPVPNVSSSIVFLKPKEGYIGNDNIEVIGMLMNHKKKKIRNAVLDSVENMRISKEQARQMIEKLDHADERAFKLEPDVINSIASEINKMLRAFKKSI